MTLKISAKLSLPDDAARWTFADLAIKSAGKTYAACVMAEEFVKVGIPIVAIDPMGIWWGLRVGVDGHEGLPVVVFGGRHADLAIPTSLVKGYEVIDEAKVRLMVKAILEGRMSAVIDSSQLSKSMSRRLVAVFVEELYRLNQDYGIRHVFLEEADEWVPQRQRAGDEWGSRAFGAVDRLIRLGGNFLLGCTLISQRSAVISKDVLSQINCLIALRILHKLDKDAVKTWVQSVADPEDKKTVKFVDSLRDLRNGEAWVWHPEDPELFDRIQFRKRETLHATREYFTQSKFEQKDIRMMDVDSFVQKFKAVFEPKPKAPTIEQRPIPPPAPKAPIVGKHRDQGLGSDFQRLHDKIEDEMDGVRTRPEQITLEEKQLVISISHSEKVVRETTDTAQGMILFVLYSAGQGNELGIKSIVDEAAERGMALSYDNVRKNTLPKMAADGLIIGDGHGNYRLPRHVRHDIRETPA